MPRFEKDAIVQHPRHGRGSVRFDDGESVLVRFEDGVVECLPDDLQRLESLRERAAASRLDPAINVVAKILAHCILSVNDSWGVFSRSRIALLPHQLWVCQRVLREWPTRWLVADDVGLGKTIEAGLILTPLLSSGRVRRLLILAPASLVEQWHVRLREMFDIRMTIYAPSADTPRSDYWNGHHQVVASAHTLRIDTKGRWKRLLESTPWDLVLIDEAHHMNVDEDRGRTLTFELVEKLQQNNRVTSMVLFTGTPHRGKDHGFLSLLKLLRPEEFDPHAPLEDQVHRLRSVMIRNNKQRVTDMQGKPLFTPVLPRRETFGYASEEAHFYDKLTEFIVTGKTYAAGLGQQQQRTAILTLITMQKLASSSIAAVRRALARRLARLRASRDRKATQNRELVRIRELIAEDDPASFDEVARLEEQILEELGTEVHLNPDEIPALEELLVAADEVTQESRIRRILEVIDEQFAGQSVLLFTEYKATQALVMSALQQRYGDGCVAFINGDGFVEGVRDASGQTVRMSSDRIRAADQFNRGDVRFLVSTEAAGEGVDLQENCSALIHVDLPWNPMRLHQRVGRLSRYGQTEQVEVVTIRNPDTIESRIWECIDNKLDRITLAFQGAMDDPEDMRQLVMGMASPRMFHQLFEDADAELGEQRLAEWFDSRTATFGGADAVGTVRDLFGNVARFDFGEVADQIPKVDLPDLVPFFKSVFTVLGKRPHQEDRARLSFRTPPEWMNDFAIAEDYRLLFDRELRLREGEDIAGVGSRIVDRALQTAVDLPDTLSVLGDHRHALAVFALRDRVTDTTGTVRRVIVGMQQSDDQCWHVLRDWELLKLLNPAADRPRSPIFEAGTNAAIDIPALLEEAEQQLRLCLNKLDLPFSLPMMECIACLIPSDAGQKSE